jgi:hypothetical protein
VLELAYGRGAEPVLDVAFPLDSDGVEGLSWQELQILARRVVGELPVGDATVMPTTVPVAANGVGA